MDTSIVMSVVLTVIFTIFIVDADDITTLSILGFSAIGIAINLETVFGIAELSYLGWGVIFKALWIFVAISAFGRGIFNAKDMFDKKQKRSKA